MGGETRVAGGRGSGGGAEAVSRAVPLASPIWGRGGQKVEEGGGLKVGGGRG